MAVNLWTPDKDKILTYLWYLDVKDMAIAEKFTNISQEECSVKYTQFPKTLPNMLQHESHLNVFPQTLLRTSLAENFEIVEAKACKTGLLTSAKVYDIWLENSQTGHFQTSSKVWSKEKEIVAAYLWYAGIRDHVLCSKLTGMTRRQSATKFNQFPGQLPPQLQHAYKIQKTTIQSFQDLQKKLDKQGLKKPLEVYNVWKHIYGNASKVPWPLKDLIKLCETVFSSKQSDRKISWVKVAEVFPNKTQSQCEQAYRAHIKKTGVISDPSSNKRALCECFLINKAAIQEEEIKVVHDDSQLLPPLLSETPFEQPDHFAADFSGGLNDDTWDSKSIAFDPFILDDNFTFDLGMIF